MSAQTLENEHFKIVLDRQTGAVSSFVVKRNNSELISEKKLEANFRLCLPLDDYLCNYIDGMEQKPESISKKDSTITVVFSGMRSSKGSYPIDLTYSVTLNDDCVSFKSKLVNHDSHSISEFWFPRFGGWKDFGQQREPNLAFPGYNQDCSHSINLFKTYPGGQGLGSEGAEWSTDYPGMTMPWWDIYDEKSNVGLYMGYHDTTLRYSTWHTFLMPNRSGEDDSWLTHAQAGEKPVGLVFSHVRYPFIHSGETFESGEFLVRVHQGDWHYGSHFYRNWFLANFPFDKSKSWLRKKSAWFTSIIYQPEDKVVTDFKGYQQWTLDAKKYGIDCFELIGWNNGGLERNYPLYVPEEKLGGHEGFKNLLKAVNDKGDHCLVFCNYNILDKSTDWYKKELYQYMAQDQFGNQSIWMGWGESTLLARKGLSVRYHVRASVVPALQKILEDYFVQLVKDGAYGFQIDKMCVASSLDFNPLNTAKPDVALCQGVVDGIAAIFKKCQAVNPEFRLASEFSTDRLIPFFDIGYRNSAGYQISPLRYVFSEWTACQHVSAPRDFRGVNGAVLTGSVICVEPETYQGTLDQPLYRDLALYIAEVERIRNELADIVFLGKYYDTLDAQIIEVENNKTGNDNSSNKTAVGNPRDMPGFGVGNAGQNKKSGNLYYKVHGHLKTDQRAIVLANDSEKPVHYQWKFTNKNVNEALLYIPFGKVRSVKTGEPMVIKGNGLHFIVEKQIEK